MRLNSLIAFVLCLPVIVAHAADKPNVLFIAVDDMNDWIGPLGGYEGAITPNLDRLARMGMTFTNAHTASSACHSSRVAVMTGVRPTTTGITANVFNKVPGPSWRKSPHLKDAVTLSQHFRNNGYRAVGGGKIFHSLQWWNGSENDPATWDLYFPDAHKPIPFQVRAPHEIVVPDSFFGNRPLGSSGLFGWGPTTETDEHMSDYKVVDWAISELSKRNEKPFFIAAGIFRPHIPWEVPKKYFDMYPLDDIRQLPERKDDLTDAHDHGRRMWHQWVLQNDQWPAAIQGYLASITFADAQIGRLLDALDQSPHKDNTIVVLWSDHGMHIGEKENWEKFTVFEESTRVPLFVVAPGITKAGSQCRKAVSTLDIYPTLVELAGTKAPPKQLEGESLLPLIKNPKADRKQPAITSYRNSHSVRTDAWRYCYHPNAGQLEELYDHKNDPNEFTNLAYDPKYANQLERHRHLLAHYTQLEPPNAHQVPDGFRITQAHRLRKNGFELLSKYVTAAKRDHAAGKPIVTIGQVAGRPKGPQRVTLKRGESIVAPKAPNLANRPIRIEAKFCTCAAGGVIVAHGGDFHGYALHQDKQKLWFTVRRDKKATTLVVPVELDKTYTAVATLGNDGKMQLSLDGQQPSSCNAGGLINAHPNEGLDAGRDRKTQVGKYGKENAFGGDVHSLTVTYGAS